MMNYTIELALDNMRYSIDNLTDKERYQNIKGRTVPSVTEIIHKMIHSDTLMIWANSIGLKGVRYYDYMNRSSSLGTESHAAIERFIKEKERTDSNIPFLGFMLWYNNLLNSGCQVEIIGSEMSMACLWFGGTCDLLIRINGKVYIVDFKTSNHVSTNYFIQLGGYKYLIERELNIQVDGGLIVLQLNKDEPGYDEYILLMDDPTHYRFIENCVVTFLSLVYAYYHVIDCTNSFNSIFDAKGGYV